MSGCFRYDWLYLFHFILYTTLHIKQISDPQKYWFKTKTRRLTATKKISSVLYTHLGIDIPQSHTHMRENLPRDREKIHGGDSEEYAPRPQKKAKGKEEHDQLMKQKDSDTEMFIKVLADQHLGLSITLIQDR